MPESMKKLRNYEMVKDKLQLKMVEVKVEKEYLI
jgi:hypothetical protein